jgi:DNA-directed RNA polymerase specialized sigma24 family protein
VTADTAATAATGVPDDATLVRGVATGDGRALGAIYDRYAGRLLGFCQCMLHRQTDAEQSLRIIFMTAAQRLGELRDPTMLRAWLFAVARHDCQTRLDARGSTPPDHEPDAPNGASGAEELGGLGGLGGLDGLDGLADDADTGVPIDLFDETPASGGLAYADQLPLELADRQSLDDFEVAAAIGVPRTAGAPIVARARKAARRSGAGLGEGRAFAAEMVALRSAILAAAATVRPAAGGSADGWVDGWPPSDPTFAGASGRRRWGAPLAVLVVLLLALGATLGLLSALGGSSHHVADPVSADSGQPSSASAAGPSATPSSSPPSDTTGPAASEPVSGIAVQPPTPSAPTSAATTATSAASTYTVVVSTDQRAIVVSSGRAQASCPARTTCSFSVAPGAIVTIADNNSGRLVLGGADSFSAPPSCTNQHGSCTFAVNSALQITLKTPGIRPGGGN